MSDPAVRLVDIRETPARRRRGAGARSTTTPPAGSPSSSAGCATTTAARASTGLDYSAHPTALDRLRDVCDRVADEYDVHGRRRRAPGRRLAIGDVAVVVATTAAHRGEAFDASRDLIDTLKAEVPIWKHQLFADGTEEWVGAP